MRIAVAAGENQGLQSEISYHLKRSTFIVLVDVDNEEYSNVKSIENPFIHLRNAKDMPAFFSNHGIEVFIAGGMGSGAIDFFNKIDVTAVGGASGSVKNALRQYFAGELSSAQVCGNGHNHNGIKKKTK